MLLVKNKALKFEYKNWKGKVGIRRVMPKKIWYGSTKWHPDEGWLLKAHDLDKDAERDFAVMDIIKFISEEYE